MYKTHKQNQESGDTGPQFYPRETTTDLERDLSISPPPVASFSPRDGETSAPEEPSITDQRAIDKPEDAKVTPTSPQAETEAR